MFVRKARSPRCLPSHAVRPASEFDRWLRDHGATGELIVAIFKKASGRQTVTFDELLETALCHGWVDTQTKGIDDERYAIRSSPAGPDRVANEPEIARGCC